jgi:DNA polymerase-3 subunit delta'
MPLTAADALALLQKADENGRLAHAYLITGPEGSGKRQLAGDLCGLLTGDRKSLLAHPDVHAIEPESKSRRIVTEQVRELERELQMRSSRGGRKVGIIFDADRLQPQASNAFLKTLEEPPGHSHLLLVTSLPDQLLETILSRCIEVPLQPTAKRELSESQKELLEVLGAAAARKTADLPQVFTLVREFQRLLSQAKERAQARGDADLKVEEQRYKNIADPKWLEEREEYFKALTESRYVGERTRIVDTLEQWWADVLRQQAVASSSSGGTVHLDFPDYAEATASLAGHYPPAESLQRAGAIETLRDQLRNTGINEPLAIEVAFLRAFGDR